MAWPKAPTGVYGYPEVANYIIKGHQAHSDCRSKLSAVKP